MTTRTQVTAVTFKKRFALPDTSSTHPPGTFRLETDEESIDGLSFVAYRRIATRIHISRPGSIEVHSIDPDELKRMLEQDAQDTGEEYEHRDSIGVR